MKTKNKIWIVAIIIIIVTSALIYRRPTSNVNTPIVDQKETPKNSTSAEIKTYTSEKLGIFFEYQEFDDEIGPVTIQEKDNTITVNEGSKITVIDKAPNLSLAQAINTYFLAEYDPQKCWVKKYNDYSSLYNYEHAGITFNVPENNEDIWSEYGKYCPKYYTETNGISYFMYNPQVPNKFIFVMVGQAVSALAPQEKNGNHGYEYTIKIF